MGYPTIADTMTSTEDIETTRHDVALPDNVAVGDLLVIFFATDGANTITDWNNFTELFNASNGTDSSLSIAYKIADGTEVGTVVITTTFSEKSSHVCYRIINHNSEINPPEVSSSATGTSARPNSDILIPTGGSDSYLWICAEGHDSILEVRNYPTDYTLGLSNINAIGTEACGLGVAGLNYNGISQNPDNFELSGPGAWISATMNVYPLGFFPTIASTNTSAEATATTSHTVNLPSDISSGDLLLVFFTTDGDNTISDWDDFIELFNESHTTIISLSVGYKIATGSEGSTITITTTSSESSAHVSYRIINHDSVSNPPEVSTGVDALNANPNSDLLTPTGGSDSYLWTSIGAIDTNYTVTNYPSNYDLAQFTLQSGGSGACSIGIASRNLEASSENPGSFTIGASRWWYACTVCVYPAAGESSFFQECTEIITLDESLFPGLQFPVYVLKYTQGIKDNLRMTLKVSKDQKESLEAALEYAGRLANFDKPFGKFTEFDGTTEYQNMICFLINNCPAGLTSPLTMVLTNARSKIMPGVPFYIFEVSGHIQ